MVGPLRRAAHRSEGVGPLSRHRVLRGGRVQPLAHRDAEQHRAVGSGSQDPNAPLTTEAIARTYRYLDTAEVAEQKKAAKDAKTGPKK